MVGFEILAADLPEVNKVVIAQDSLQRFINSVSPGAYASITKVDFKALARFMIKPLGVYGSKVEIIRLLQCIGAIDDEVYVLTVLIISPVLTPPPGLVCYSPQLIPVFLDRCCPRVCT